jgi:hypothetical protein
MLVGWNPLMEPREMFNQITSTYGKPTPAALLLILQTTPSKYYFGASKILLS